MTNLAISAAATILITLYLFPITTTAADTAVLDIDGHPLKADTNYYILPVIRGQGGGLTLESQNSTQICPLYVAQDNLELSKGLPLRFYPINPKESQVHLSTDLNIAFIDVVTICIQSGVWSLANFDDDETQRLYIGISGRIGDPGIQTISNWFKIEKAETGYYDYKIVSCPGVCEFCLPLCGDIGVFIQKDGTRFLSLITDQPFLVMFKKA